MDDPECGDTVAILRHYLVGRALAEADGGYIRELGRVTHPLCAQVVAELAQESQETVIRGRKSTFMRSRRGSDSAV